MKRTVRSKYDTDWCMKKLFSCLISDSLVAWGGEKVFDIPVDVTQDIRDYCFPSKFCWNDAYKLKWHYQLESFLQRYRFKDEPLDNEGLGKVTMDKFRKNLLRVSKVRIGTPLTDPVIGLAKQKIAHILGDFCEEELMQVCKFGTRSTVGNPLAKSYLDLKLYGPITGSARQIDWFRSVYLPTDPILSEIMVDAKYQSVFGLKVTLVPKSYKIKRPILANTLIGNFHSAGLGDMLVSRLKDEGLDIKRLQDKHRRIVKGFSVDRSHVTADLSAASDSITVDLVQRLLPKDWYEALNLDTFPVIEVEGKFLPNPCFCTMGIGYTFPLQTLIFYSLLLAIKELAQCSKGFCSVYGDDLIYPTGIHKYVVVIFPLLGFQLNMDKTYAEEHFRESCGADFCRGVDVRPFKPMATCERLSKYDYSRFIYKLINGLLERWNHVEVPKSLYFLYGELCNSMMEILVVPPSFPATAGIKVDKPWHSPLPLFTSIPKWKYRKKTGTCSWVFDRLSDRGSNRTVRRQLPYYWDKLRSFPEDEPVHCYASSRDVIDWIRVKNGTLVPYVTRKGVQKSTREIGRAHV